jgi:HTH-type transcriptional regulator/antitoxin HigA
MIQQAIKPIKSETDYEDALTYLYAVMDADEGSQDADTRDVLVVLIEDFEERNYPIQLPDPIDAIKFRMDQAGLIQKDLIPYIGSRSKVSEVLSRKRNLSSRMIRSLHRHLGISLEVLIQEPVDR